jgi:hypothetical protein
MKSCSTSLGIRTMQIKTNIYPLGWQLSKRQKITNVDKTEILYRASENEAGTVTETVWKLLNK